MIDKKQKIIYNLIPIFSIVVLIALWAILSALAGEGVISSPKQALIALIQVFSYGEFYFALGGTLLRTLIAFVISFSLALLLAFFSKKSVKFKKAISPIISVMRTLPTVAVVLVLLFWTNEQIAPVVVTSLIVLPTSYVNVFNSLESVDSEELEMCKAFGVSKKDMVAKLYIPKTAPSMLMAIGAGLCLNLKLMVAAEVLAFTAESIGYYLKICSEYDLPKMLALVVVTVIIGLIIEGIFTLLSKKAGKWQ
jgi:NitT/TauT family transport system permease protein